MSFLKKLFTIVVLIISTAYMPAFSQAGAGTNQLGLRLGGFSGITFRHITGNNVGIELDVVAAPVNEVLFEGLIEKNFSLGDGFAIYIGAGGFIGGSRYNYYRIHGHHYDMIGPFGGLEAVIGGDYYFQSVPLAIGIDFRPRLYAFQYFSVWDAGLNFRYVF